MKTPLSFGPTNQRYSFVALATLVLGLTATLLLFVWTYRVAEEREDINFERYANARVSAVRQRLFDVVGALEALDQTFKTFGLISRDRFHSITLPLLTRYPYVKAFAFHRLVSYADRPAFEASMRKSFPGFMVTELSDGKIVPAAERDSYRVADYIEPLDGNEVVHGFDAGSNPRQAAAAQRARDTGLASVSGALRLIQEKEAQRGIMILMPVYRPGALLVDVASRRSAIVGYCVAVLRADEFIQMSLDFAELPVPDGGQIDVYAPGISGTADLLYRSAGGVDRGDVAPSGLTRLFFEGEQNRFVRTIDVAGMPWSMVVSAKKTPFILRQYGSLLTLVLGTLFSAVAAAYLQLLASRSWRIQRLVDERTAELQESNSLLNKDVLARQKAEKLMQETEERLQEIINVMPVALFVKDSASRIILMNQACEQEWGVKFRDIKNTDAGKYFPPDQMEKFLHDDQAIFAGRQLKDYEEPAWNSHLQETRVLHTFKNPVFDQDGNPRYLICLCIDITQRKQAEQALRESQILLRKLAAHQNQVKESERQRIAREIHDDLGQNLLVLRIDASMLHARTKGHVRLHRKVDAALHHIDVIMKSVRTIINDLRPSVLDLGLLAAIEWQVRDFERRSGIKCTLNASNHDIAPDDRRALELFRILQESLTNVLRHAQATEVSISLTSEIDQLVMRISDNGIGIFPDCRRKANSFGLLGIEERIHSLGGKFSMESEGGQGTSLTVTVPSTTWST